MRYLKETNINLHNQIKDLLYNINYYIEFYCHNKIVINICFILVKKEFI